MLLKNNIRHSVCQWCYNGIPLDALAMNAKEMGITSVELLTAEQWPVVLQHGLTCAIAYGTTLGLTKGFNDPKSHAQLKKEYIESIPLAADAGLNNIICFTGNRNGINDETGLENCARGLEPILKVAAKYNVTLSLELLNSTVDHPDYQCDHTMWGVRLCDKVGSPNLKLLYDIYHMQIMEGNVIATIKKFSKYIAHYHTGGVPGRHEIDETQELYYPAVMLAIVETGYQGFVGQESLPTKDPMTSLRDAIQRCDV